MSNHPIQQQELMAYLDGELEAGHAAETASHLKQCLECQKLAADLQDVSQMMMAWHVEQTKAEVGDDLTAALEEREREKPSGFGRDGTVLMNLVSGRRLVWAGGLAAVVLLVLAVSIPSLLRSRTAAKRSAEAAGSALSDDFTADGQPGSTGSGAQALAKKQAPATEHKIIQVQDGVRGAQPSATPQTGSGSIGSLATPVTNGNLGDRQAQETPQNVPGNASMIIRTADLSVTVKEFEKTRLAVDEIVRRHHGHVGELSVSNPTGAARSLTGTLRIPSNQLDAALADLKSLGRVETESQSGEEVTEQYVDLQARLANAKHTEQRLIEIQGQRTGKLSDVLAVEVQISRVRGEIEQMEARRKSMKNQVDFATLNLTLTEDYKKELSVTPPSIGIQFRNSAVEGLESLSSGIIAVLLWLLSQGPTLLLLVAILFFPVRGLWRKVRPRLTPSK